MSEPKHSTSDQYKGWLYKWTNYIKGYQKRWFVLQNGLLSYYRNQAEMNHTCRGTICLANAFIHTEDSCSFIISNGSTQTFHLKASSEIERQRWVTALELAKTKAITLMESAEACEWLVLTDEEESEWLILTDDEKEENETANEQPDKNELQNLLRKLNSKLEDLNTCNDLITKHGTALQRALSELEQLEPVSESATTKIKAVNERATLFRITSNAMINACHDYLELAQVQGKRWERMLKYEHDQRLRLEEVVEQLAKQHESLEKQARRKQLAASVSHNNSKTEGIELNISGSEEDFGEDDFYDALDDQLGEFSVRGLTDKTHKRTPSNLSTDSFGSTPMPMVAATVTQNSSGGSSTDSDSELKTAEESECMKVSSEPTRTSLSRSDLQGPTRTTLSRSDSQGPTRTTLSRSESQKGSFLAIRKPGTRRRRIPERPNYSINLWSIMKNSIGRDLSKIPMPVNFSEPLSFLQRLMEDNEYADVLHQAALCKDSAEQLAYVAAFTVSSYSTTTNRSAKPFNPLLGETYEFDRMEDLGWRSFTEQVSHHPPMVAMYTEAKDWMSWQEFTMSSKFRGKYLQIIPLGISHLVFPASGNHYTWRKVTTTVHNIIVGRLWVDNHGEMEIVNHKNGDKCHMKYLPYSYFSRELPRKVTGVVTDKSGVDRWVLQGTWDDKIEGASVLSTTESSRGKLLYETGPTTVMWQRTYPPPELEKCYCFTEFAVQLNELEEGMAPTDSRLRPDQRLMEEGRWDEANDIKLKLEEKQRYKRREREQEALRAVEEGREYIGHEPIWFRKETDPQTGNLIHIYKGEYWQCKEEGNWDECPDIFL